MMPYLKEVRKELKCHIAGLPITYRTTMDHPTFFNLPDNNGCSCHSPHETTFPTALDPMQCNRYEIKQFAKEAYDLGINYLGVCCGATPMLIREVAEAVGLKDLEMISELQKLILTKLFHEVSDKNIHYYRAN